MEANTFFGLAMCLLQFGSVAGFPNGEVSVVCDSMVPRHTGNSAQTSPSPYTITVSNTTFNPGQRITVSLQGNGNTFAGFLLQARTVGGDFTVGSFEVTDPNAQGLECNNAVNAAVSHTSPTPKSSLTVIWVAPPTSGYVRFRATFVQNYNVFWTLVESQTLQPGNDDIYICLLNTNGQVTVQTAYSTGKTSPTIRTQASIESPVTSFNNGIIKCTFISRDNITLTSRSASNLFYIFLAFGPVANDRIRKHSQIPFITSERVDILEIGAQVSTSSLATKVKVHGALMLIAWMTTGSIGMLFARYLKEAAKRSVFGKDLWFQVHQLLMGLTVVSTAIAFIVIFTQVMGWSYYAGAHPVLGCIVMILSLLQPIVALFRPGPKESKRYIFNWFHAMNAMVIKVLAVATLFLGFQIIDTSSNLWLAKVLGGFVGWEILALLLLEVNIILQRRGSNTYELKEKEIKNEAVVATIYIFGNFAFLIALLVGIGQS